MRFGSDLALIVKWHPAAIGDLLRIDTESQRRIKKALAELQQLEDARLRLVPYTATLKGYWKLRVGDYRLVCQLLERNGEAVLIVHAARRSIVYRSRSVRSVNNRSGSQLQPARFVPMRASASMA